MDAIEQASEDEVLEKKQSETYLVRVHLTNDKVFKMLVRKDAVGFLKRLVWHQTDSVQIYDVLEERTHFFRKSVVYRLDYKEMTLEDVRISDAVPNRVWVNELNDYKYHGWKWA